MKSMMPNGCGNAPRVGIIADFVTTWAKRDIEALAAWLADDARWTVAGRQAADHEHWTDAAALNDMPDRLEVTSIITHGRHASCDGFLDSGTRRTYFSHVFTFASASKAAAIREMRTYLVEDPA